MSPLHVVGKLARACAALALPIAAVACVDIKPPLLPPAEGGRTWTEFTSPHFTLRTDDDPEEARAELARFEGIVRAFEVVAFTTRGAATDLSEPRIEVVLFNRVVDYEAVAPHGSGAMFDRRPQNDALPTPRIVMQGRINARTRFDFQHELAHHYIHRALGYPPVWLNEGLAQYYSTLRVEDGRIFLGDPLPTTRVWDHMSWQAAKNGDFNVAVIPAIEMPYAEQLLRFTPAEFYAGRAKDDPVGARIQHKNYAAAWALVHLMLNGSEAWRPRFADFIRRTESGEPWRRAWDLAFEGVSPAELEERFHAYLTLERVDVRSAPYSPPKLDAQVRSRALSDADVRVLFARLRTWRGDGLAGAVRDLDAAAAEAPRDAGVLLTRGLVHLAQQRQSEAEADLARAVDAAPTDPSALAALLEVRADRARREKAPFPDRRALIDRLAGVARTADALEIVAREKARANDLPGAEEAATRAVTAEPACLHCLDTLAIVLFARGRAAQAIEIELRAADLAPDDAARARILSHLDRFRAGPLPHAEPPPRP